MNLGQLDRQVLLQQPAPAPANPFGGAGQTQAFADVATVWARVQYPVQPGTEAMQAAQLTAVQQVSFTIRYRADVGPTWQVSHEGRTYQVTARAEIGRRVGVLLTAVFRG